MSRELVSFQLVKKLGHVLKQVAMDPVEFTKHNKVTSVQAEQFIREVADDWTDGRLDTVMDLGCGSGNASTYWIDHCFPDIKRLIGIDIDPGMIELARKQNKKDHFEFHVADIMDRGSLGAWTGRMSHVFSHFVLHRVGDQKQAFEHVLALLAPSGAAALHLIVRGPFYASVHDLLQTPKWRPILEPSNITFPESFLKNYSTKDYRRIFEEVGFKVTHCEMKVIDFSFESDENCKNLLWSLHSIGDVADDVKEDYKNDLFERFVEHSPRDGKGLPTYNATTLRVRLLKEGGKN